jgi:hypothetical protein
MSTTTMMMMMLMLMMLMFLLLLLPLLHYQSSVPASIACCSWLPAAALTLPFHAQQAAAADFIACATAARVPLE